MIDLNAVESSMIAAAGYEPDTKTLFVLFNSGVVYEYHDVPRDIYDQLMAAESKGRFMNDNVIDQYSYARFRGWNK